VRKTSDAVADARGAARARDDGWAANVAIAPSRAPRRRDDRAAGECRDGAMATDRCEDDARCFFETAARSGDVFARAAAANGANGARRRDERLD